MAEETDGTPAGAAHRRMAKLYEKEIADIGEEIPSADGQASDPTEAKAEFAAEHHPGLADEYAEARAEAAELIGKPEESSEWQSAAERLSKQDG